MNDFPAFPLFVMHESGQNYATDGMTMRDYFAAKAMQGNWSSQHPEFLEYVNIYTDDMLEKHAKMYYRMADAMLKAREIKS